MIKSKGLDNGNHYTKDDEMRIFQSSYSQISTSLSDENRIKINGANVHFGEGNIVVDVDRFDTEINHVCTWGDLAQSGDGEYYLVVGLPIAQYEANKDKYYDLVMSYNQDEVIYKGKKVNIQIKDVTVFAQGIGAAFYCQLPDGVYIIIDIGSYTINVVMVELINSEPIILKYNTWYDGVLTFYETISSTIDKLHGTTVDLNDIQMILKYGYCINGNKQSNLLVDSLKKEYIDKILTRLKLNYKSYATTPILLCGGGASLLQKMLEGYLNNAILMSDSQFVNAIGYHNYGVRKYTERR